MSRAYSYAKKYIKFNFLMICVVVCCNACNKELDINEKSLNTFQQKVSDYFIKIAFGFEFDLSSDPKINKWNNNIKVHLHGATSDDLIKKEVEKVLKDINHLTSNLYLNQVVEHRSEANVFVFVGTKEEYKRMYSEANFPCANCTGHFTVFLKHNYIHKSYIYISKNLTGQSLQHTLREELTQIIGLGNDASDYPNSIFYETPQNSGSALFYSDIDKEVIKILYSSNIRVDMNTEDAKLAIRNYFLGR